jgi:hypothetical protein
MTLQFHSTILMHTPIINFLCNLATALQLSLTERKMLFLTIIHEFKIYGK